MSSKREPGRIPVADKDTQRALDDLRDAVRALARDPFVNATTIEVELPNATVVRVNHRLGRKFQSFVLSPPQGPSSSGRIEEHQADNPAEQVWLEANGYGATVTVRMTIW